MTYVRVKKINHDAYCLPSLSEVLGSWFRLGRYILLVAMRCMKGLYVNGGYIEISVHLHRYDADL